MKAILVVDIPVDESCENDEFSMAADMHIYPTILTDRPELFFDLYEVALRPMPMKRKSMVEWVRQDTEYVNPFADIYTHEPTEYDKGWNDCVEFLEGEENG